MKALAIATGCVSAVLTAVCIYAGVLAATNDQRSSSEALVLVSVAAGAVGIVLSTLTYLDIRRDERGERELERAQRTDRKR